MTKKRTGKRVILCLLIFFVVGMLLAAYIARQIHLRSLPVVETVTPAPGTLRNQITVEAVLRYTDEIILRAPADMRIASVEKRAGDRVKAGEILFAYDPEDVRLALLSCRAAESALRQQASDALNALLLLRLEDKIGQLERLLSEDGRVESPAEGWVLSVDARAGDCLAENMPVLTMCDGAGKREILWTRPEDGIAYTSAVLAADQGNRILGGFQTHYDPENGKTYVSARLPEKAETALLPGQRMILELRSEARSYDCTLPLSCLCRDTAGREYVYLVQKRETARGTMACAVQRTIYVLDRDGENFAFSPAMQELVVLTKGQPLKSEEILLAQTDAE